MEKYANTRECENETEASDCYNEESDKEQIFPRTCSGWEEDTYTNGFEEDQVKFNEKVKLEKGMYCFAFRKFGVCSRRNCRYMHVNENAACPNYSSKRDIPRSPGCHIPKHRTKGRNTKGTVNGYQPYQERIGICFKFRDTGYFNVGQKCRFKHLSCFNKSQGRNFSAVNQSNSFFRRNVGVGYLSNWLSSRNFFRGAKSIVMQISFVMLLFSDQISGGGKSLQGGNCLRGGRPPCERKAGKELDEVSQAGGPIMAFQGYQIQQYQPQGQFTQTVCPTITQ